MTALFAILSAVTLVNLAATVWVFRQWRYQRQASRMFKRVVAEVTAERKVPVGRFVGLDAQGRAVVEMGGDPQCQCDRCKARRESVPQA
jgi:hypothetical protein